MDRRIKLATTLASAVLIAVAFTSCPNLFSDNNLKDKLKEDVAVATARVFTLTIESDANGISTPTGAQSVKEGIPFEISTNPFSTHAFSAWSQTGGTGTAVFADDKTASTTVTVTGGNASIKPVFVVKPKVLYATPMGNDIPKNSRVTIVFSKDIDASTVSAETITITENGVGASLGGQYSVSGGTIKFIPDSPLNAYKTYVISATTAILDTDGIALIDSFSSAFKTGNTYDNEPPVDGAFEITGTEPYVYDSGTPADPSDDVTYVKAPEVTLNNIFALDDSEIPYFRVFNDPDAAETAPLVDFSATLPWTLDAGDGEKTVYMTFQDQIGNESLEPVSRSILLDTTPPEGSVSIAGGADFTGTRTVALTLSATDPAAGSIDGSGMADGTMTFANDSSFTGAASEAYAAIRAGWELSDGDGQKTVYARFADALGNETTSDISDTIYLDTTAPTGTVNGGVSAVTATASVTVSLSLSDGSGSGVDVVQLISSDAADGTWTSSAGNSGSVSSGAFAEAAPAAASFTFDLSTANADNDIVFRVWDALGNYRDLSGSIRYDTIAPTLTSISINGGAAETNSTAVTVTISGAADANGGTVAYVGLDNDPAFANPTWLPYALSVSWALEDGDGTKTVYVKLRDTAGNVTASAASDSITLDTAAPEGAFVVSGNATYTNSTSVSINSSVSGVVQMRFSDDGTNWSSWTAYAASSSWTLPSGDGSKTVYGQYRDAIGNLSAVVSDSIILDTAAPTGSIMVIGTGDGSNAYTNTLSVSLSLAYDDALAGPSRMRFSTDNLTWSSYESLTTLKSGFALANPIGATYRVYYQLIDKAGNESVIYNDAIIYDNAAPTISSFSINAGAAWTNYAYMALNPSASDALSGLYQLSISNTSATSGFSAWETYTSPRNSWYVANPTVEGTKQVWIKVRDRAGNESSAATDTIGLDLTAPTVSSVALNGGAATTPSLQASVTITASDTGGSGLAYYRQYYSGSYGDYKTMSSSPLTKPVDWPFNTNAGNHYVYVSVKDAAGNVSSWVSDYITLEVPTPLYAMKGFYTSSANYVFGNTVSQPSGTNYYYFYSTTNPNANPNAGDPVDDLGYDANYPTNQYDYVTCPVGELRYFFMRVRNDSTGGYGPYSAVSVPGWTANVTVIYDANDSTDTALAQAIKSRLERSLPADYPSYITGTQPAWSVILIPETMVATSYIAGTTYEAYYKNVIYGDPTIVTPGTSVYANANQTRNLVSGNGPNGVVGMGYGGTRLIDTVNSYWTTWGLSGTQPANIGYLNSAAFTDSTSYGYSYHLNNTVWSSPLSSSYLSASDGSVYLSSTPFTTRYSVYRLAGAAITGGWLYEREPANVNYFGVAHQGRFLHIGFGILPNYPISGSPFFVNLIARMDDY